MSFKFKYQFKSVDVVSAFETIYHILESPKRPMFSYFHACSGCSSHTILLDKFGKDVFPVFQPNHTEQLPHYQTEFLCGVLSWVWWLAQNNIASNTNKLIGS